MPHKPALTQRPHYVDTVFIILLLIVSSTLFLANLGNHYLWQDEAQTAVISKTILERGLPYGTDGVNYFSQERGMEYGHNYLWKWHTWLSFYTTAACFKLFGITTFSARVGFALAGMATIFLVYYCSLNLFKDRKTAVVATTLLLLCIPYVLLARQSRYYSFTALFSLLSLYSYIGILQARRHAATTFVFSSVLLFQTHYFYWFALLATVGSHSLLLHRKRLRSIIAACTVSMVLCLPWIYWFSTMRYGESYGTVMFKSSAIAHNLVTYFKEIILYIFPPYLLLIPPAIIAMAKKNNTTLFTRDNMDYWSHILLFVIFILTNIAALALVVPAPYFRYLAPLIPILAILAGLLICSVWQRSPALGILALIATLTYQPLPDFLYEITHDYDGPIEGIVNYLNSQTTNPNDVVAITNGDMPLKFYTDLRVVGGFTGEDLSPARDARWIIFRQALSSKEGQRVQDYLVKNRGPHPYRLVTLDAVDIVFENRESLPEHHYRTVRKGPRVQILERID